MVDKKKQWKILFVLPLGLRLFDITYWSIENEKESFNDNDFVFVLYDFRHINWIFYQLSSNEFGKKKCTKEVFVFFYVHRSEPFLYTSVAIKMYLNLVTILLFVFLCSSENIHLNFVSLVQIYVPVNFKILFAMHPTFLITFLTFYVLLWKKKILSLFINECVHFLSEALIDV